MGHLPPHVGSSRATVGDGLAGMVIESACVNPVSQLIISAELNSSDSAICIDGPVPSLFESTLVYFISEAAMHPPHASI
jgi:hypothetical protein